MSAIDAAVIGCSAGGLRALQQILAVLRTDLGMSSVVQTGNSFAIVPIPSQGAMLGVVKLV